MRITPNTSRERELTKGQYPGVRVKVGDPREALRLAKRGPARLRCGGHARPGATPGGLYDPCIRAGREPEPADIVTCPKYWSNRAGCIDAVLATCRRDAFRPPVIARGRRRCSGRPHATSSSSRAVWQSARVPLHICEGRTCKANSPCRGACDFHNFHSSFALNRFLLALWPPPNSRAASPADLQRPTATLRRAGTPCVRDVLEQAKRTVSHGSAPGWGRFSTKERRRWREEVGPNPIPVGNGIRQGGERCHEPCAEIHTPTELFQNEKRFSVCSPSAGQSAKAKLKKDLVEASRKRCRPHDRKAGACEAIFESWRSAKGLRPQRGGRTDQVTVTRPRWRACPRRLKAHERPGTPPATMCDPAYRRTCRYDQSGAGDRGAAIHLAS